MKTPYCKSGNVTTVKNQLAAIGAAARQCCVANGGMSYATMNGEGCTTCVGKCMCADALGCEHVHASCGFGDLHGHVCHMFGPEPIPSFFLHATVYGFFATMSDGKLLGNTSVNEGRPGGRTVYFGLLKGMLPSIRRVQFTIDGSNLGQGRRLALTA